ncbi:MAG: carbamoyltransferase HypF, partial [Chitinophagaceae bacterium]|nr:carbamoyltransferase HypF [Chitinophagaceae bacterium]
MASSTQIQAVDTWHMHLSGLVQGVGFRPLVYQLAKAASLQGAVCNDADGLHIWVNASAQAAAHFLQAILAAAPPRSVVTNSTLVKAEPQTFNGFTIVLANAPKAPRLWIPPDFALCEDCKRELHEAGNRREHYPFITCTTCGPRYSIIQHLPFERGYTTMQPFTLCDTCATEYNNVHDRRFFAQTTSCPNCGVQMTLTMPDGSVITDTAAVLEQLLTTLQAGKMVAIKGIGGFLLLTDAGNATAIDRLRNRKKRPAKPLAVMYPSLQMLEQHVSLTAIQQTWLTSPVAPIVLLPITGPMQEELATEQLAPGLQKLGIMLPYAPLFEWLLTAYKKPVAATSANLSGSPIIYQNEQAQQHLLQVADVLLYHNRNIVMPQDDSVLSMAAQSQTPVWLRRSRGLAPACSFYTPLRQEPMLATGALMKSSFAIAQDGMTYISQYMGSTESYDAQLMYREGLVHVQQLLQHRPSAIITDKHPAYFSHELALELAAEHKCPLLLVQHHKAHAAAVLAENNLLHQSESVLAVVMDGTGLGDDGNSWG